MFVDISNEKIIILVDRVWADLTVKIDLNVEYVFFLWVKEVKQMCQCELIKCWPTNQNQARFKSLIYIQFPTSELMFFVHLITILSFNKLFENSKISRKNVQTCYFLCTVSVTRLPLGCFDSLVVLKTALQRCFPNDQPWERCFCINVSIKKITSLSLPRRLGKPCLIHRRRVHRHSSICIYSTVWFLRLFNLDFRNLFFKWHLCVPLFGIMFSTDAAPSLQKKNIFTSFIMIDLPAWGD